MDEGTAELVRRHSALVDRPAGERILAELVRLSDRGYERLDALGLLAPLGGTVDGLGRVDETTPELLLVEVFGEALGRWPISNELRRFARALQQAEVPAGRSPREVYRFRRATEPWAVEAARFAGGGEELVEAIREARRNDPAGPLLRGDELGLAAGPEIGRLLELVEEERAAGTISTREEALELVRREAGKGPAGADS
jgi:hypothetical protein